jgi:hypothetical protein
VGLKGERGCADSAKPWSWGAAAPACATRGEEGDGEWRGGAHHGWMTTTAWARRTMTALGERDESDGFEQELARGAGMGKKERSSRA